MNDELPDSGGFTAVGYSAGRQMVDANCSVRLGDVSGAGATMLNDCAALPGDSGAPIIRRGTGRVVAMISGFHAGSVSCIPFMGVVHKPWTSQCTNGAIPLSVPLIEQIERANWGIYAQNVLLRLGYDVGPYGDIDQPLLARAIQQVQIDMGMVPTGEFNGPLCAMLRIRALGI